MDVNPDIVKTNKSRGELSWLWALIADDWGYPRYHTKYPELLKCLVQDERVLNLLYILSFLRTVDELSKQKDIKPILCAPCVCWTRLVGPCLWAEDGPRCRASCSYRVSKEATHPLTRTKTPWREQGHFHKWKWKGSVKVEKCKVETAQADLSYEVLR